MLRLLIIAAAALTILVGTAIAAAAVAHSNGDGSEDRDKRERLLDEKTQEILTALGVDAEPAVARLVVGAIAATAAIACWLLGLPPLLIVLVPVLALIVLALAASVVAKKRRASFTAQLANSLPIIAASLRSGSSLASARDSYCENAPEPLRGELARVSADLVVGTTFPDALRSMSKRTNSSDVRMLAATVAVQSDTGSGLADIIDKLAETIRDRQRLRDKARAMTATNRMSSAILTVIPVLLLGFLLATTEKMRDFYTSADGLPVGIALVCMLAVGSVVLHRMTDVKID